MPFDAIGTTTADCYHDCTHHFSKLYKTSVDSHKLMSQREVSSPLNLSNATGLSGLSDSISFSKRPYREVVPSSVKRFCQRSEMAPKAPGEEDGLLFSSLDWKDGIHAAPSTPSQVESLKVTTPPLSRLESLPLRALTIICNLLGVADLCRICEVSRNCLNLFAKDEFWSSRAIEKGIQKAVEGKGWKWNIMVAVSGLLHASPLDRTCLVFKGDLAVVDPFKIFFTGYGNQIKRQLLVALMQQYARTDCVVTYRGIQSAFITSKYWDDDTAFEISRKTTGARLGADFSKSGIIAAIPMQLVNILIKENNESELQHGVIVNGVNGEFRSSRDGDFIIRVADPSANRSSKQSQWVGLDEVEGVDIVCAAGGSWTFSDDSSDDDDVVNMSEQELAKALEEMSSESVREDYSSVHDSSVYD